MSSHIFASVESVVEDFRRGGIVVVRDDNEREAEGDLTTMAAELVAPEAVPFMAVHGQGLVCLALAPGMVERLGSPYVVGRNEARLSTAFTASIEAKSGVTTGISAANRTRTIQVAAPHGLHRGCRGTGAIRQALPGRSHLRGNERRRRHGPGPGPGAVRVAPQVEDGVDSPNHRIPPQTHKALTPSGGEPSRRSCVRNLIGPSRLGNSRFWRASV